ncbi:uncharacterized protein ARMOST_06404 [Armillaria ostoyae]|uniref:Uncharacterized protein n=1 Tax=Armillaria ostoyae TaxID=47428 RepID=A0A284R2V9_ARMOS|nr:uncharacterized protein ARMOST_06404 [Armillaria ostoyae]
MVFVVHIWGYFCQKQHTRESVAPETEKIDIYDHGYARRAWFYIFCGILGAIWQTTVYWLMGAMSNDLSKLAFFVGFYKPIQLAGAAGMWYTRTGSFRNGLSLSKVSSLRYLWLFFRIKNHTDLDDETITRMDDVKLSTIIWRMSKSCLTTHTTSLNLRRGRVKRQIGKTTLLMK